MWLQVASSTPRSASLRALWEDGEEAPSELVGEIDVSLIEGKIKIEVRRLDEAATGPVEVTVR